MVCGRTAGGTDSMFDYTAAESYEGYKIKKKSLLKVSLGRR